MFAALLFGLMLQVNTVQNQQEDTVTAARYILDRTVFICKLDNKNGKERCDAIGSGFIISKHGHVGTATHVVVDKKFKPENNIFVLYKNVRMKVTSVFMDKYSDISILTVPELPNNVCIPLRHSLPPLGTWIMTSGSLFGGPTVMQGIVSTYMVNNLKGAIGIDKPVVTIIVDAIVNPGNSGGPAIDKNGELIGVISAHFTGNYIAGILMPVSALAGLILRHSDSEQIIKDQGTCKIESTK